MKLSFSTPVVVLQCFTLLLLMYGILHACLITGSFLYLLYLLSQLLASIPAPFHFYGLSVDPAFNVYLFAFYFDDLYCTTPCRCAYDYADGCIT